MEEQSIFNQTTKNNHKLEGEHHQPAHEHHEHHEHHEPHHHDHKPHHKLPLALSVIALLLGAGGLTLAIINAFTIHNWDGITVQTNFSDGNSASFKEGSISDIASKVSPSVVSVVTETRSQGWYSQDQTAAGTGFIVTKDGYIVTNKHVVDGARSISVILDDGTTYTGVKTIGTDPLNDIAIIKIQQAVDLPAVTLGDSKTVSIGQQVIAIGNALGQYGNTVSSGIISGQNRTITASDETGTTYETLNDMLQTDAAINQGNSGGPLVNAAGEVIGINTAISANTNGQGIGFAIPVTSIKGIVKRVVETGTFERAYLGIFYQSITPELAKEYNLPVTEGAYIYTENRNNAVIKDGPADKAGLEDEDIIIAVNNTKIGHSGSVSTLIGEYAVGDTVQLTILRDGEEKTLKLKLEAYQD